MRLWRLARYRSRATGARLTAVAALLLTLWRVLAFLRRPAWLREVGRARRLAAIVPWRMGLMGHWAGRCGPGCIFIGRERGRESGRVFRRGAGLVGFAGREGLRGGRSESRRPESAGPELMASGAPGEAHAARGGGSGRAAGADDGRPHADARRAGSKGGCWRWGGRSAGRFGRSGRHVFRDETGRLFFGWRGLCRRTNRSVWRRLVGLERWLLLNFGNCGVERRLKSLRRRSTPPRRTCTRRARTSATRLARRFFRSGRRHPRSSGGFSCLP